MATTKEKFDKAKRYIDARQYDRARGVLEAIDHPTANKWLNRLDEIQAGTLPDKRSDNSVTEAERAAARLKSYTDKVVIVIILYFILFLPGLIANSIWHEDGKRMERIAGQALPGVAALGLMRKMVFWIIAVCVILTFLLIIVSTIALV
jgi:hypothetical protein